MIKVSTNAGVATLVLSRPPVNAVSEEMIAQLDATLDELAARTDWKVLHLRSDQKVFCAGADLAEVRARFDAPEGPELTRRYVSRLQQLYRRIEHLPQVTLAEIGGAAMGGGLELALACDLRIVALEAKLGLPEARLGLIPGAGGTQRLTRLCGRAVASRLILTAEIVEGADALRLGIAQWAAPWGEIETIAARIAAQVAALPAAALRACKACIATAAEPGEQGFVAEVDETRKLSSNAETRERVAAFLAGQR
jgi:enoyl-CoA hydratase/carnithine racemase